MTGMTFLIVVLVVLAVANAGSSYTYSWSTLKGLDHFLKKPSQGILVSGRLTVRQVRGIAESGFKTMVSMAEFATDDASFNNVTGDFPSSAREREIFESYGLDYVLSPTAYDVNDALALSKILANAAKPVFLHCFTGYSASVLLSTHLYLTGALAPTNIVPTGVNIGFNFLATQGAVDLINNVTGLALKYSADPVLELTLANKEASYKSYDWPHRVVSDAWYNVGQVLESHVDVIAAAGYRTVVSLRVSGEATNRLSTDPTTGFVANEEFSDANGYYSAAMEQAAFEKVGVNFHNVPVASSTAWTSTETFYKHFVPTMLEITGTAQGPTLVHCASGYRSAAYLTAFLALQGGQCTSWAVQQAKLIGYAFDENSADASVISFYSSVLEC